MLFVISGCRGCSGSGRHSMNINESRYTDNREKRTIRKGSSKNVIKMQKINGVYQIPIEVNGVTMFFIFDTGAATISISLTETTFLYKQGLLKDSDIKGTGKFVGFDGNISEGMIINLKTIKIGNKTLYNIEASVVNNLEAPLLLGQSALDKFGKINIDYEKNEISFEE